MSGTENELKAAAMSCPVDGLVGEIHVPGDKSISHRSILTASMCVGKTSMEGLLESEDVLATVGACRKLGATIERIGKQNWQVHGVGVGGFMEPDDVIDCGNSGTSARLLMGAVATTRLSATFTGDESLRSRPMRRVCLPLGQFGTRFHGRSGNRLPLTLVGAELPVPIEYDMPVASAQVKSAIIYAGLNCRGETTVIEHSSTRDHTERMLKAFGARVAIEQVGGSRRITVQGHAELKPLKITVPGDISSAAFPLTCALVTRGSNIVIKGVGINRTRTGYLKTLMEMGASLSICNRRSQGGERLGDIVAGSSSLKGIVVPPERAPTMIDEYPMLAVAAAFAEGDTVMRGIREMRIKESDRIAAMVEGLGRCGVNVTEHEDGLTVHGHGTSGVEGNATCRSFLDHRIAMSFLCLGVATRHPVSVDDIAPISTSFPRFIPLLQSLGARIKVSGDNG